MISERTEDAVAAQGPGNAFGQSQAIGGPGHRPRHCRAIAAELNARKIPTARGGSWSHVESGQSSTVRPPSWLIGIDARLLILIPIGHSAP
jgi:hypothetical protein